MGVLTMKALGFFQIVGVFAMAAFLVNCSAVKFDKPTDSGQTANSARGAGTPPAGDDASGNITDPGSDGSTIPGAGPNGGDISNAGDATGVITGTGNAAAAELPKVQFIGPPCQRLTNCVVTFQLDKAYSHTTEFDWKTNDSLYGTAAAPGLAPWGKPGYPGDSTAQYVPTSGHVSIAAGQTQATVYVRNINQQDVTISIGVLMSSCAYNTLLESCQKFFSP
jgi:hypothetical protein